jgi:hypothetical protein
MGPRTGPQPIKKMEDMERLNDLSEEEELFELISHALKNRKTTIKTQKTLEGAWKKAMPKKGLNSNRPMPIKDNNHKGGVPSTNIERDTKGIPLAISEALKKEKMTEEIQQKIFLVFQAITEEKYEDQIILGKKVLRELSKKTAKSSPTLCEDIESFLKNEDKINKKFIKSVRDSIKELKELKKEIKKGINTPCRDARINKILDGELFIMSEFVESIMDILNG